MQSRHAVGVILVLAFSLLPGKGMGLLSPAQFKLFNFNLYSQPTAANSLYLRDLNDNPIDLKSLQGKVVILNFWRIDCPPCRMEKPILERVYRKYAQRGLVVLCVNLFDNYDKLRSFTQGSGFSFPVAYDPEGRFTLRRHAIAPGRDTTFLLNSNSEAIYEIPAVPTTYVINRQGEVVGRSVGMINWEQIAFTQLLESLLGPAPSEPPQVAAQPPPPAPVRQKRHTPDKAHLREAPSVGANAGVRARAVRAAPVAPYPAVSGKPVRRPASPTAARTSSPQAQLPISVPKAPVASRQETATPKPSAINPPAIRPRPAARSVPQTPIPARSSLPRAMPYQSKAPSGAGRSNAAPGNLPPPGDGYMWARMPESPSTAGRGRPTRPQAPAVSPERAESPLPQARPVSGSPPPAREGRGSIENFIMDSFGR